MTQSLYILRACIRRIKSGDCELKLSEGAGSLFTVMKIHGFSKNSLCFPYRFSKRILFNVIMIMIQEVWSRTYLTIDGNIHDDIVEFEVERLIRNANTLKRKKAD